MHSDAPSSSSSSAGDIASTGLKPTTIASSYDSSSTTLNQKYIWNEEFNQFFSSLDNYAPTLPIEVTYHLLGKAGVNIHDQRVNKLVSLAADKFMADIIFDAKQFSLLRQQSQRKDLKRKATESADTLQFQDVVRSLKIRGVSVGRPNGPLVGEM
jgi:transcription initiation factor TFIID subunit 10